MMKNIHSSWSPLFQQYDFDLDALDPCYPKKEDVFRVFQMDIKSIKVCLLGQDPYHGRGQAHGLSFSVPKGVTIPPSLRNIYKELQIEFPERNYTFKHGSLEKWCEQGIFLLNSALTVEPSNAGSHMAFWKEFTDDVIKTIASENKDCVFLLLGNFAKGKGLFVPNKSRIVSGVHPSPFSAHDGFFNSNVFKKVEQAVGTPIDWSIE